MDNHRLIMQSLVIFLQLYHYSFYIRIVKEEQYYRTSEVARVSFIVNIAHI